MRSICVFPECGRPEYAKQYCNGHYLQNWKGMDLTPLVKRSLNPNERFWQKVDKSDPSGCWLWTGTLCDRGYGSMWKSGRPRRAHRISFELANGAIPAGLVIDHKCRVPSCVNPDHLQAVTTGENSENLSDTSRPNTSGYRGVSWNKSSGKWMAYVSSKGVRHHLGYFENVDDAKAAVISRRLELHTNNILDRLASL